MKGASSGDGEGAAVVFASSATFGKREMGDGRGSMGVGPLRFRSKEQTPFLFARASRGYAS
jgi:hypothetical protein